MYIDINLLNSHDKFLKKSFKFSWYIACVMDGMTYVYWESKNICVMFAKNLHTLKGCSYLFDKIRQSIVDVIWLKMTRVKFLVRVFNFYHIKNRL